MPHPAGARLAINFKAAGGNSDNEIPSARSPQVRHSLDWTTDNDEIPGRPTLREALVATRAPVFECVAPHLMLDTVYTAHAT